MIRDDWNIDGVPVRCDQEWIPTLQIVAVCQEAIRLCLEQTGEKPLELRISPDGVQIVPKILGEIKLNVTI